MGTKRQPKKASQLPVPVLVTEKSNQSSQEWKPPRGILYLATREGRPKPFGLRWRERGNPKPHFQFFATEAERQKAAKSLAEKRAEHGRSILEFTPDGWAEYLAAKELAEGLDLREMAREWMAASEIADGADLRTVAREWLASKGGDTGQFRSALTVREAVTKYLELRYTSDVNQDGDTGRHLDLHLAKRFVGAFGDLMVDEVTPEAIRDWLANIKSSKTGEKIGNLSRRHHRKDVNTFFKRAQREEWVKKNPCERVDLPKIQVKDVQILTVQQARAILSKNVGRPIAARLALEMFGGLRAASVERLKKEHIDWDRKGIRMPGELHKSQKTVYRQGQPDVLWAWLTAAPETTWTEINEGNYGHEKVNAIRRAFGPDFTLPHNSMRHSFASYHLAANKSLSQTGYLMQHTSTHTTTKYEGMAQEQDAKDYFALTPDAVVKTP